MNLRSQYFGAKTADFCRLNSGRLASLTVGVGQSIGIDVTITTIMAIPFYNPFLFLMWHRIFYMPSRIDEAGHTKAWVDLDGSP